MGLGVQGFGFRAFVSDRFCCFHVVGVLARCSGVLAFGVRTGVWLDSNSIPYSEPLINPAQASWNPGEDITLQKPIKP